MRYANLENLIADYLPEAKSEKEIAAVGRILDNISSFIDTYCRRPAGFFAPVSEENEKRVRGEGKHFLRLPVHQFGTVTQVKTNGGTVISSAAYYESEKNGWLYAEEGSRSPELSFDSCSSNVWEDSAIFKVTAKWGYAATPPDLEEAVRLIVVRIYETQRGSLGQITPSGFVIERLIPPAAKEILDFYKRREFEI